MYLNARPELGAAATTLPARHYIDPELFRAEMEGIYFEMWVCAGRAEELPSAGSYFVRRLASATSRRSSSAE